MKKRLYIAHFVNEFFLNGPSFSVNYIITYFCNKSENLFYECWFFFYRSETCVIE